MTSARRTFSIARAVECFAAGLCLTLVASSMLMAVEAHAAPSAPQAGVAPVVQTSR